MPAETMEIAVVVVCLNALPALQETLASLCALADPRLRVYVVDGRSRDGTEAWLASVSDRLAGWVSEPDRGIYDAMNKGWNMTPADAFVLYLGAGDRAHVLPSDATLQRCLSDGIRIVIGTCRIGTYPYVSSWTTRLHYANTAHHQALLAHRAVAGASPFDSSLRVYADWDFNLRLFELGHHAHFDPAFQTFALPGGVSARHDLPEIWRVSYRHGGAKAALRSYLRNLRAEWRSRRNRRWTRAARSNTDTI